MIFVLTLQLNKFYLSFSKKFILHVKIIYSRVEILLLFKPEKVSFVILGLRILCVVFCCLYDNIWVFFVQEQSLENIIYGYFTYMNPNDDWADYFNNIKPTPSGTNNQIPQGGGGSPSDLLGSTSGDSNSSDNNDTRLRSHNFIHENQNSSRLHLADKLEASMYKIWPRVQPITSKYYNLSREDFSLIINHFSENYPETRVHFFFSVNDPKYINVNKSFIRDLRN